MIDLSSSIVDLKAEFVCEALDLGQVHLLWTGRHLQQGRFEEALSAFDKFVTAVRVAAPEMRAIKIAIADKQLAAEASSEWRDSRGRPAA